MWQVSKRLGRISTILHGVVPKKAVIFVATSLITSDITEPIFRAETVISSTRKMNPSKPVDYFCALVDTFAL
jgi:hypothetical protein